MKTYTPSKYNICNEYESNDYQWIVANTFTGAIILADNELKNFLFDYHKNQCSCLSKEQPQLYEYLIKNNFLVDAKLNELDRLKIRFQQDKYNEHYMHLTILPTINCNLACPYCYEDKRDENMTLKVIQKLKKFVTDKIDNLSNLNVTWYGGEPLLQIGVIEKLSRFFIQECDKKNVRYNAKMITNGTLLTDNIVDILIQSKVTQLQVTIDGPEDVHNKRRYYKCGTKESFQDIIRGLKACQGNIPVNIRINVDYSNIEHFKELIDYLKINGLLGINSKNGVSLGLVKKWTANVKMDEKKMLSINEFGYKLEDLKNYLKKQQILSRDSYCFNPTTPCGVLNILNFLIMPNGELSKCWIHSTERDEVVGNLENGLDFSTNSTVTWTAYDPTLDNTCAKCSYLPVCAGGCPYDRLNNLIDKEEYCKFTRHSIHDNLVQVVKQKYK